MDRRSHILAVPYPAQGHVSSLLKLAYQIADHGIKVTFVNTESIHAKLIAAMPEKEKEVCGITLASIPDGLDNDNDRKDGVKFSEVIRREMPGHLTDLIEKINHTNHNEPISCVIVDVTIGWILEVAEKTEVEKVTFCPFGPACLVLFFSVSKLIDAGIMNSKNGSIKEDEHICLSKDIPPWRNGDLIWTTPDDLKIQEIYFEVFLRIIEAAEHANWLLCNTSYELDSPVCNLVPEILPVGPLLTRIDAKNHVTSGSFCLEDASCLGWLNEQQPGSVVYVAFGSIAVISQHQFDELALGLELSGRPFLWVVRSDIADGSAAVFPDGFLERVANHGKIVEWAPQEKVLAHPSIACFLTHCGWNSTMECLSAGVPFLCWPYFADQFHNQYYICDIWKVGLKLNSDENGFRSRHEIMTKVEKLLSDDCMKVNAVKLKDLCQKSISKGGSSYENLLKFIKHLKL